jgi:hypothetical protein
MWGEAYFLPLADSMRRLGPRFGKVGRGGEMTELIIIVLLVVMVYYLWVIRRALIHICAQLALVGKFTEEIKCHITGTSHNPDDDINKLLGI